MQMIIMWDVWNKNSLKIQVLLGNENGDKCMCEYCNLQKYEKSWEIDVLRKTVDIDGYTLILIQYNHQYQQFF